MCSSDLLPLLPIGEQDLEVGGRRHERRHTWSLRALALSYCLVQGSRGPPGGAAEVLTAAVPRLGEGPLGHPSLASRRRGVVGPPQCERGLSDDVDRSDPDFAVWLDQNVKPHKQAGYAIVNISLKPIGGIPGDASSAQIDVMADLAEKYSFDELRVTHAQNIVLPHVAKRDLYAVWQALNAADLANANLDLISDIIACPGLDYCSLANARSIPIAQKIATRFADAERQRDLGELKLKISGCINACGHHHAGHIGILGVDRKGVENYQLTLGGSGAEDVSIGKITGPGFDEDGIVDAFERAAEKYKELREPGERFVGTYRRVGMEPFKEAIYG